MFGFGYTPFKHKGFKFYAPHLLFMGNKRHSRNLKSTATDAQKYAERWARRLERMVGHNGKLDQKSD